MNITLHIPDEVAERLSAGVDLQRQALEGLALESFRRGQLSKAELRQWLDIRSRYALDGFLKAHDVYDRYTVDDLERERTVFRRLGV